MESKHLRYEIASTKFNMIPGNPIAYWISNAFRNIFSMGIPIEKIGDVRTGISTGKNDLYLRLWYEISCSSINFYQTNINKINLNEKKYIPYNKGGDARKWYGNNEYVVNWSQHDKFHRSRPNFSDIYLKKGLTWSFVTSGMFSSRYYPNGFLWDVAGSPCVFNDDSSLYYILGFLSTKIASNILKLINPTLNCQVIDIQRVPIIDTDNDKDKVINISIMSVKKSKDDWDSFETSWDFKKHPLI